MINVIIRDLPASIKGFTKKHEEGFTIVINAKHDDATRLDTYYHELRHIERGDMDRTDTQQVELEVINGIDPPKEPTLFGIPASEYLAIQRIEWAKNRRRLIARLKRSGR